MEHTIDVMLRMINTEIFSADVDDSAPISFSEELLGELYTLSKKHDLSHIVASALEKQSISGNEEILSKFQKQLFGAVYRYEKLNYELTRISDVLESEGIAFIPLKGSVIRNYYPEPWMRTSCDIDILVREGDIERAKRAVVEKLNFEFKAKGRHDLSFYSQSGVHLELHYSLIESDALEKADVPLTSVWSYVSLVEGKKYHYALDSEMFYYYHIAHMAKHFTQGGCGIRPFLDIRILNNSFSFDMEKRRVLLERGGLSVFARQAEHLSEVWFGNAEHSEVTKAMQDYLLSAGAYGDMSNRVVAARLKKGGRVRYAISRIWLPYEHLRFHYPSLEKRKYLLPLYEIRRWGKLIFCGGMKRSAKELHISGTMSSDKLSKTEKLFKNIGL